MSKQVAPTGLDADGKALWSAITTDYTLRADEKVTLEAACRATDRLALMRDELAGMPLMLTGSTGQQVVNPLVAEIRAHEAQVSTLLAKLKLPDVPAAGSGPVVGDSRSTQARSAAQSRWSVAHGTGA